MKWSWMLHDCGLLRTFNVNMWWKDPLTVNRFNVLVCFNINLMLSDHHQLFSSSVPSVVRCHPAGGGVLRSSARHPHRSGPRRPVPVSQPAAARQPDCCLLREEDPHRLQTAAGKFHSLHQTEHAEDNAHASVSQFKMLESELYELCNFRSLTSIVK